LFFTKINKLYLKSFHPLDSISDLALLGLIGLMQVSHPFIFHDLSRGVPLFGVKAHHLLDETLGAHTDPRPLGPVDRKHTFLNVFHYFLVVGAVERRESAKKDVKNHAHRPNVTFLSVFAGKHFGSDVVRGSRDSRQVALTTKLFKIYFYFAAAEIHDFNFVSFRIVILVH
jgi:hypothetical protein